MNILFIHLEKRKREKETSRWTKPSEIRYRKE